MPSLKQLEHFLALAENGNMTKLSEERFISQTALSNSIARLEAELGVKLFDRVGRNIVLNEYGKAFLQYVGPAINSLAMGQQVLESMRTKASMNVSVAIASSTLWGALIGSFLSQNPECSILQRECRIDNINGLLPKLDVDLIIAGSVDFDTPFLESVKFISDPVRLYVPIGHRLANRKTIKLIEAKDENFIFQPKHAGFSKFSNMLCKKAGFTPKIVAECDYTLRRELLRHGAGVVLASDTVLRANFFDNCVPILIEDEFAVRDMSCFWLKNRPLSPAAIKFRDFVVDYYSQDSNAGYLA